MRFSGWHPGERRRRATAQAEQKGCDDRVRDRDRGGDCKPDRLTMHEAEERQHGAGRCKSGGILELFVEDECADGSKNQTGQNGAPTEDVESLIQYANSAKLIEANGRGAGSGRTKRTIHQGFAPTGKMRCQGEDDRGCMRSWCSLERLSANQHTDIEEDR